VLDRIYGVADPVSDEEVRDPMSEAAVDIAKKKLPVVLVEARVRISIPSFIIVCVVMHMYICLHWCICDSVVHMGDLIFLLYGCFESAKPLEFMMMVYAP